MLFECLHSDLCHVVCWAVEAVSSLYLTKGKAISVTNSLLDEAISSIKSATEPKNVYCANRNEAIVELIFRIFRSQDENASFDISG